MQISRIVVENHRVVPDLNIRVRKHLVLVGPNSSGKTSLLRVLDLALGGSYGQLVSGFPKESLRDPTKPLTIEVRFGSLTADDRAATPDEINVKTVKSKRVETLELVLTVEYDDDEPQVKRVFRKPGEDRRVRRDHLDAIGWGFLPATRSPERELGAGRRSALRTLVSSIDLGDDAERVVKLLTRANAMVDQGTSVVELRTQLATELTGVLPRPIVHDDLTVQVASVENADPVANAELRLKNDLGEAAPLHHQSDGVRSLSAIVVQRLAAPASIVAIDEPEIHLHPRSQARLAHLLATGTGQRIVATHAAAVLAAFDPTDVVALADGNVRQISAASSRRDSKFFAQWWTDAAVEPLTANVVALVEGPSDRTLLLQAARLLGHDLDQHGCSIVVAHGAPLFKPLVRLYGSEGFDLDVVGLVDVDEAPIAGAALDCKTDEKSLQANGFVVSSPDLEGECVAGLGLERHAELLCESSFYDERQILGSNKVSDIADLDPARYTEWCRKDKVLHAAALAATMNADDAKKIVSLVQLVQLIKTR